MTERSIFIAALEKDDPTDRAAFLNEACAGNPELRQRIERLLKAHEPDDSFLASPAAPRPTIDEDKITERPGTVIGPYKLMEQIGEGGMGLVFVADQDQPIRRRVALKIIKPGLDSKAVAARFEAERQALAMMDHQNIAKVYDAGTTTTGRPYFVMELVHGVPITEYCDANKLTPRQRLDLFVPICQAIQHAHQKGIIHRDIKPSNVLVTMYDDKPVPKVIDFGVAKAIEQRLTERTVYTQFGTLVGTFEYMSPEQAEMNAFGVDTRSDIYSLGVLLYELLTGSTPLERPRLREAAFDEIRRLIKEEEAPRPSVRLSTSGALAKVAAARQTDPAKLSKLVRGELDWVVMRCLDKDRTRRYETASGLARDVQRYLADEPVEACPPSLGYRMRKAYRRHRAAVLVGSALLLVVAVGLIGTTLGLMQAVAERRRAEVMAVEAHEAAAQEARAREEALEQKKRAEEAEQRAKEEAAAARAVRDFLQDDLLRQGSLMHQAEVIPVSGPGAEFNANPTIRELLDRAATELTPEKMEVKFPHLPFVQAEVLKALGQGYLEVKPDKAIDALNRAVELYRTTRGADDPATLSARHSLAMATAYDRKTVESLQLLEAVCADRIRVLGATHPDTMVTRWFLGAAYLHPMPAAKPISYYEQIQRDGRIAFGPDDPRAMVCTCLLGRALIKAKRFTDALRELEPNEAAARRLNFRADHPFRQMTLYELATAYKETGKPAEAIPILEELLRFEGERVGEESMQSWPTRHQLGWCYLAVDRQQDAISVFEKNVAIARPPWDATSIEALGWAIRQVDLDRSITLYTKARALRTERNDPEAPRVGRSLAMVLRNAGRHAEALALLDEILPQMEKTHGPDDPQTITTRSHKIQTLFALKQHDKAAALCEETIARIQANSGATPTLPPGVMQDWSLALEKIGRYEKAVEVSGQLVAARRSADSRPLDLAYALLIRGRILFKLNRPAEAEPLFRDSLTLRAKADPTSAETASSKMWLGTALHGQRKDAEAETLLVEAFNGLAVPKNVVREWVPAELQLTAERLIAIYTAQNKPIEAAAWQKRLDGLKTETKPAGKQ